MEAPVAIPTLNLMSKEIKGFSFAANIISRPCWYSLIKQKNYQQKHREILLMIAQLHVF